MDGSAPTPAPSPLTYAGPMRDVAWPPRERPRVWPCFVAPALVVPGMFALWIVAFVIWRSVTGSSASAEQMTDSLSFMLPVMIGIGLLNGSIALGAAALSPVGIVRRLSLNRATAGWFTYGLMAVGTLTLGFSEGAIVDLLGIETTGSLKSFQDMSHGATSTGSMLLLILVIGIAPGICEELMFRGYVQTRLVQRWGPLRAIAITSLMFGAIHMDALQSPLTVGLGAYLGWIAYRTGSIRPAMFAHAFNNTAATLLSMLGGWMTSGASPTAPTAPIANPASDSNGTLIFLVIASAVCIGCTLLANYLLPPAPPIEIPPLPEPQSPTFAAPIAPMPVVQIGSAQSPLAPPVQDGDWYTS